MARSSERAMRSPLVAVQAAVMSRIKYCYGKNAVSVGMTSG